MKKPIVGSGVTLQADPSSQPDHVVAPRGAEGAGCATALDGAWQSSHASREYPTSHDAALLVAPHNYRLGEFYEDEHTKLRLVGTEIAAHAAPVSRDRLAVQHGKALA